MTILIADDSPPIRGSLRRILHSIPGIDHVVEASDGQEAQNLLESLNPDVLILDLQMPNKTGMEVLHELHGGEIRESTTIVILTNYATPEVRQQCLALGANYVLDKAMEFEHIIPIIQKAGGLS